MINYSIKALTLDNSLLIAFSDILLHMEMTTSYIWDSSNVVYNSYIFSLSLKEVSSNKKIYHAILLSKLRAV